MPLLCIALLALLPLPPSLACSSGRPLAGLRDDYFPVVQTDINNTKRCIATLLLSANCTEPRRRPRCTADHKGIAGPLHALTCRMMKMRLNCTETLTTTLQHSIRCPCHEAPTPAGPAENSKDGRRGKSRRLCRAAAMLSAVTECYEMLNSILVT